MALALGTVVSTRSSRMSEVTRFRSKERRCAVLRPSFHPATLWRMAESFVPAGGKSRFLAALGMTKLNSRNYKISENDKILGTVARPHTSFLQIVIVAVSGRGKNLVRGWAGYCVALLVDLHSQTQSHGAQNFFDFVQRLAAEVFGLEHFGFSLLHQFADRLNVCILQAVVAAHGKLEFLDRTIKILVLDLGLAFFGRSRSLDILFEVDEDIHVVLQQLRRQADGISRSDGAVGPDFKSQLVVVCDLPETRGFHGVIALAYRRVDGVDGDETDAEIFVEILVGRDVSAAALEAHFHVELAAFADGGNVDVFIQNLDIRICFDHARCDHTRLIGAQIDGFGRVAAELEGNLLQVQDDVGGVLDHSGDRLEFVQYAFDLYRGDCCAFDRGKQHTPEGVADGRAESAFEWLGPEDAVFIGEGLSIDC